MKLSLTGLSALVAGVLAASSLASATRIGPLLHQQGAIHHSYGGPQEPRYASFSEGLQGPQEEYEAATQQNAFVQVGIARLPEAARRSIEAYNRLSRAYKDKFGWAAFEHFKAKMMTAPLRAALDDPGKYTPFNPAPEPEQQSTRL